MLAAKEAGAARGLPRALGTAHARGSDAGRGDVPTACDACSRSLLRRSERAGAANTHGRQGKRARWHRDGPARAHGGRRAARAGVGPVHRPGGWAACVPSPLLTKLTRALKAAPRRSRAHAGGRDRERMDGLQSALRCVAGKGVVRGATPTDGCARTLPGMCAGHATTEGMLASVLRARDRWLKPVRGAPSPASRACRTDAHTAHCCGPLGEGARDATGWRDAPKSRGALCGLAWERSVL